MKGASNGYLVGYMQACRPDVDTKCRPSKEKCTHSLHYIKNHCGSRKKDSNLTLIE